MRYKTWYVVSVTSILLVSFALPTYAEGTLGVTNISAEKTYAQAGGGYSAGWKWTLAVTVPDNEPVLRLKFGNWANASGSFSPAGNVRFYSAQSSNTAIVANAISIIAVDTYSNPLNLLPGAVAARDLSTTTPGRQIEVVVETKIPEGAAGGSYAGSFGVQTLPDTTPPVIALIGNASIIVERGTSYTEQGATATDNIDGAIASTSVAVSGSVIASSISTYTISYSVSDAAGNTTTPITRTVLVQDTIVPTGVVNYNTTTPTNQNVIATLTPSETVIFLNTTGIATTTSGTATTTFTQNGSFSFLFADVAQNTGSTTASVSNIDKNAPTIANFSLNGVAEDIAVNIASTSVAIALAASEPVNWLPIKIENQANSSIYKLFQSGETCADWTTACNKTWTGALSQGTLADGAYRIRVRASDAAGNEVDGYLSKTIAVDTTAPVITLNGSAIVTHDFGTAYTDAGTTASDARDGAVSVVSSSSVNVNTEGDYTITYTATDALGNTATATRTVQVRKVLVTSVVVSGFNGATTVSMGSTLQMNTAILPANATNASVSWIIGCNNLTIWGCPGGELASSFDGGATISSSGLITPIDTGTIRVRATANDGSGTAHLITITVN